MPVPSSLIERLLAEDVPHTDLTTEALGIGAFQGRMEFRARGAMTVAGIGIAAALISHAGAEVSVSVPPGARAEPGDLLLSASGPAAALHLSWKAAQTLTEILSGIATATRALVDAVEAANPDVKVACSRKTVPLTRQLSAMAIRAGGAINHRLGLSETILVFAEHRVFLPDASFKELAARLGGRRRRRSAASRWRRWRRPARPSRRASRSCSSKRCSRPAWRRSRSSRGLRPPARLSSRLEALARRTRPPMWRPGAGLIVSSWPYTAKPADVAVSIARAFERVK